MSDGSLAAVTDPQSTAGTVPAAETVPAAVDAAAQRGSAAQPGDVVARLESAAERLRSAEDLDTIPLTELAEQLAALHGQLHAALSELDRT